MLEDEAMIGDFLIRLESKDPLVSTATLNDTNLTHNGNVLTCSTMLVGSQGDEIAQITILVKGELHVFNMLLPCARASM